MGRKAEKQLEEPSITVEFGQPTLTIVKVTQDHDPYLGELRNFKASVTFTLDEWSDVVAKSNESVRAEQVRILDKMREGA